MNGEQNHTVGESNPETAGDATRDPDQLEFSWQANVDYRLREVLGTPKAFEPIEIGD